jgi:hypothetical protein
MQGEEQIKDKSHRSQRSQVFTIMSRLVPLELFGKVILILSGKSQATRQRVED